MMVEKAKQIIREHIDGCAKRDKIFPVPDYAVFVVWQCKALQNWKFLLATNLPDQRYYELTYNGDKKEWYLDDYVKIQNKVIKEEAAQ